MTMKSTTALRTYETGGQLSLLKDKGATIADLIDELQSAASLGGAGAPEVESVNGAIGIVAGSAFITKAGVCALTLAAPTVTTDDGKVLSIISTTAFAHTVTTPSNKIRGSQSVVTFDGNVGDFINLRAYQGVWYPTSSEGCSIA